MIKDMMESHDSASYLDFLKSIGRNDQGTSHLPSQRVQK